ncbi:MAG: hypothetical protein WC732_08685 [Candidatus Omnitrophota bacterium]
MTHLCHDCFTPDIGDGTVCMCTSVGMDGTYCPAGTCNAGSCGPCIDPAMDCPPQACTASTCSWDAHCVYEACVACGPSDECFQCAYDEDCPAVECGDVPTCDTETGTCVYPPLPDYGACWYGYGICLDGACTPCNGTNPITGICDECQTVATHDTTCECTATLPDDTPCTYGTCKGGLCTGCIVNEDCPTPDPVLPGTYAKAVCNASGVCWPEECPENRIWDEGCLEPCTAVTCTDFVCFVGPCASDQVCIDDACVDCEVNADCVEPCIIPTCSPYTHQCISGNGCPDTCDANTSACNDCFYLDCVGVGNCTTRVRGDGSACADGYCLDTRCVPCIANDGDCAPAACRSATCNVADHTCTYNWTCSPDHCVSGVCAECIAGGECVAAAPCVNASCAAGVCVYTPLCAPDHCVADACVPCIADDECTTHSPCGAGTCVSNLCVYVEPCDLIHCVAGVCVELETDGGLTTAASVTIAFVAVIAILVIEGLIGIAIMGMVGKPKHS